MSQYAVLEAWEAFKTAALASGAPLATALPRHALEKWAAHEAGGRLGPGRAEREALAASLVGAALTDAAIDKLAAEGRYTEPERQYLRELNAEAALGDLGALLKTALSLAPFRNYPKTTGAVLGALLAGGLGAWKDDENRVRGALTYAIPGAVIGGLGGAAYAGHANRALAARAEQAQGLTNLGQGLADAGQAAAQTRTEALAGLTAATNEGERWHKATLMATDHLRDEAAAAGNGPLAEALHAAGLKLQEPGNAQTVIAHGASLPRSFHPETINALHDPTQPGLVQSILDRARRYHQG